MSLNWKEIDCILAELELPGLQIQKVYQSAYDLLMLQLHGKGRSLTLLIALSPGACRLHEHFQKTAKTLRPLRFAEFCKARLGNGWIEGARQLGNNRIIRLDIRRGKERRRCYVRLWSNAANVIVTDETGAVLDAMRRSPKRGEITGGQYEPEAAMALDGPPPADAYTIRELPGPGSFNQRIGAWYAEHGGALSLDALRAQAEKRCRARRERLEAAIERLRAKEGEYQNAGRFKEYGDVVMANTGLLQPGASWLETAHYATGEALQIKLDSRKTAVQNAQQYYRQYQKAVRGLGDVQAEIAGAQTALRELEQTLQRMLGEDNPLILRRMLQTKGPAPLASGRGAGPGEGNRPGLWFCRRDWLIAVGRDAAENDALLRKTAKGRDLWLHVRDYAGSYVFIKHRPGKTVPLDILLDGGNLALFYSKGRNNGEGDLFYTQVQYLRRPKGGPKGLVIPAQEKNLHIKADRQRLKELELCRIDP
ncbi:MAG: NFACT family protein [Treponema sp.]|jgi:predicted ribosome quality control (RQC) complex YloA/Tae2 family protein|nr:NFACT family protein [Treponema sp.]